MASTSAVQGSINQAWPTSLTSAKTTSSDGNINGTSPSSSAWPLACRLLSLVWDGETGGVVFSMPMLYVGSYTTGLLHHLRAFPENELAITASGAPRVSAPSRAPPWLHHLSRRRCPWAPCHPLVVSLWPRRALGQCPGRVPTLFRRAPTRPAARAPLHTLVLACTHSPLHHLLGFSSAKYSPMPLPSSSALLSGGTHLQPSRRSLWPRRFLLLRPSRYVTRALCTPCGSRTAACPCPRVHTQPASPHPSALTPSCSVYSAQR